MLRVALHCVGVAAPAAMLAWRQESGFCLQDGVCVLCEHVTSQPGAAGVDWRDWGDTQGHMACGSLSPKFCSFASSEVRASILVDVRVLLERSEVWRTVLCVRRGSRVPLVFV